CNQIDLELTTVFESARPQARNHRGMNENADLTSGVIRISFAQLPGQPICLIDSASALICRCGFIQCARSDGWIIVKQSDTHESLARVVEISALQLDVTRQ